MKKKRFLIFLLISFIIGFIFTFFVYMGLWSSFVTSLQMIPFWIYLIMIPIVFYFTLTCHELGHLIAFRMQGVPIRALYLTIFVFYKDKKGWHFTVKPKLWILFGGLVIPDLPQIKNDEQFFKVKNIFAKSLIAAPIVTISLLILSVISFALIWVFNAPSYGFGLLSIFTIYTVLLSSLYIYTFKLNTKHMYGDFVAYRKMNEDELFQFVQITQYIALSLQANEDHTYFYHKAQMLIEKQPLIKYHMFLIITVITYLEGVIEHNYPMSLHIDQMLSKIPISTFARSEEGLTLLYMLATYYYHLNRVEESYQLLEKINQKASKKIPKEFRTYLKYKYEHKLNLKNHFDYLADNNNIYIGQNWLFEVIEDPYESAKKDHNQLPFKIYVCDIPEEKEKMSSED